MVIFTRTERERRIPLPNHGLPVRDPPAAETRFEELKRYVAFAAEDAALLRAFRDVAAPHFARIA